jgi:hypothetical protein
MLFIARARLHHPRSRPVDQLRETLEKIAADLMVDISLDEPACDIRESGTKNERMHCSAAVRHEVRE